MRTMKLRKSGDAAIAGMHTCTPFQEHRPRNMLPPLHTQHIQPAPAPLPLLEVVVT